MILIVLAYARYSNKNALLPVNFVGYQNCFFYKMDKKYKKKNQKNRLPSLTVKLGLTITVITKSSWI